MHVLLTEAAAKASRMYDSLQETRVEWAKLRVSSIQSNMANAEFLRLLKSATHDVSKAKFRKEFSRSVVMADGFLKGKKWFAVLQNEDETRSLFFLLLALHRCPGMESGLQGILTLSKDFRVPGKFSEYVYVCFDDITLSDHTIEASLSPVKHMPRMLVTPFVGEPVKKSLEDLGVQVVYTNAVKQLVKIDPSRGDVVDFKYDSYPIHVPHRPLEAVVGFPEIYENLTPEVIPPYNVSEYSRYGYLVRDITRMFVTPC